MEHQIYEKKDLKKPGFLTKLLGKKIKENALIEINNLLASKDLLLITVEEIFAITQKYGINLNTDYDNEVAAFYKQYLTSCLEDKFLSEEELADLRHLKYILGINDKEVQEIHQELAGKIYKTEVEKIIQDGELDEEERKFIEKLQNDLKLPQDLANKIYQQSGQDLIRSFMNNAIADARLTPDEEKELHAIARNLNAELKFDDATKSDLEKYKLYWQIENDELPELVVDINIPRNEKCYFAHPVVWYEENKPSEQVIHNRSMLHIKVAKGIYWKAGKDQQKELDPKKWNFVDDGELYLTNKRLLFKGRKGDRVILLNRILDFTVFANGVEVEKNNEKNPFFQFEKNPDVFAMLLGKAISQL